MKALVVIPIVALVLASPCWAQSYNPFETTDQARARHSSENYQYQQRYGTPMGGYGDRLGDPAPAGTLRPGYTSPTPSYGGNTGSSYNSGTYAPSNSYTPYGSDSRRY